MTPVAVPVEFDVNPASTKDVLVIQEEYLPVWKRTYDAVMAKIPKMQIKGK